MRFPSPVLPREHGGWAVVFTPMIVACVATRAVSWEALALAVASLAAYLSYDPLNTLIRGLNGGMSPDRLNPSRVWAPVYLLLAFVPTVWLVAEGFYLLLIFGVIGLCLFALNFLITRRAPNSVLRDLSAIAGLSLTCPSMYYVLRGVLDRTAIILSTLVLLFFAGNIFYVHMKVDSLRLKKSYIPLTGRLYLGRWTLLLYGVSLFAVVYLAARSYVSLAEIISFLPMTAHVIVGTVKLNSNVRFRNLGFLLLAQSLVFGLLLGLLI